MRFDSRAGNLSTGAEVTDPTSDVSGIGMGVGGFEGFSGVGGTMEPPQAGESEHCSDVDFQSVVKTQPPFCLSHRKSGSQSQREDTRRHTEPNSWWWQQHWLGRRRFG